MDKKSRIFIAGHNGLAGSAIFRELKKQGHVNILVRTRSELDLLNQVAVNDFFKEEKPEYVFVAAARVGGIYANSTYPADFIYENLLIATHLIHASHVNKVRKLLYMGSSCIYPKLAPQPMKEEYLLSGPLEPTNEAYAVAKIAGLKLCKYYNKQYGDNFVAAMPTNLFGINDSYHPENAHVLPALMRRFHEAKVQKLPQVVVWGTGKPKREFLYSDDLAEALILLMNKYDSADFINVGSGIEVTIEELARTVKRVVGYSGELVFDSSKPDGMMRKIMDSSKIHAMGWKAKTKLEDGMRKAYQSALEAGIFEAEYDQRQHVSHTSLLKKSS